MSLQQAIDRRSEQWIQDIYESANLPVRLRLWNSDQYELGRFEQPRAMLTACETNALSPPFPPTLNSLGETYVQGKIDLNGKLADIVDMSYSLAIAATVGSDNTLAHVVRHFTRTKESDKESIQYRYDVSGNLCKL